MDDLREVGETEKAFRRIIEDSTGAVRRIKNRMVGLERRLHAAPEEEHPVIRKLIKEESDSLNALSDGLTVTCKEAETRLRRLEKNAVSEASTSLDEVKRLYKEIEQITADLLCYSLGH